jgi:hypothetical protein
MDQSFQPPKFPQSLPGSFWGLTTFFNPSQYANKKINYQKFREASKAQGLNLLTIELAFDDTPFQLSKADADILVQLRTSAIMWQKERMLNVGLKHLPADCDKIAWIDGDLIFLKNNWISEVSQLLQDYNIIQAYSQYIRLPKEAYEYHEEPELTKDKGFVYSLVAGLEKGHPGHVWAARRKIIDEVGFFDRLIVGGGDRFMGYSFAQYNDEYNDRFDYEALKPFQDRWLQEIQQRVQGSCFYHEGTILHLWHGDSKDRFYEKRSLILAEHHFDPNKDIKIDNNGCWQWSSEKPDLHRNIQEYFWLRNEEGENTIISSLQREIERLKIHRDTWREKCTVVRDELRKVREEKQSLEYCFSLRTYKIAQALVAVYNAVCFHPKLKKMATKVFDTIFQRNDGGQT